MTQGLGGPFGFGLLGGRGRSFDVPGGERVDIPRRLLRGGSTRPFFLPPFLPLDIGGDSDLTMELRTPNIAADVTSQERLGIGESEGDPFDICDMRVDSPSWIRTHQADVEAGLNAQAGFDVPLVVREAGVPVPGAEVRWRYDEWDPDTGSYRCLDTGITSTDSNGRAMLRPRGAADLRDTGEPLDSAGWLHAAVTVLGVVGSKLGRRMEGPVQVWYYAVE